MFTLLTQIITRLGIQLGHPVASFQCIREVAADRGRVCSEVLEMHEGAGKELLLNCGKGGGGRVHLSIWLSGVYHRFKQSACITRPEDLLIKVANGHAVPAHMPSVAGLAFLKMLSSEGRVLRWVAAGLRPDLYRLFHDDNQKRWPEASIFHYMWTPVEDYVLESLVATPMGCNLIFVGMRSQSCCR